MTINTLNMRFLDEDVSEDAIQKAMAIVQESLITYLTLLTVLRHQELMPAQVRELSRQTLDGCHSYLSSELFPEQR